jgi:enoyl-CoA hydratase
MACDLIYASPTAVFGQPEVKLGVIPGFGGTQRLVRRVGQQRAKELILSGRNIKAEEAVRLGLALEVLSPTENSSFLDQVIGIARQISANSPSALRLAKRAIVDTDGTSLKTGLLAERTLFALCFATPDQQEGMAAFLEKRAPHFSKSESK